MIEKNEMKRIFAAGPSITNIEVETVLDAVSNGWYEDAFYYCEKFEKDFAKYHKRKYALMTPNCTTAIHLLLAGLGVGKGDEVIVPECTWIGSTAGITYQKAETIFCDIDRSNWCIDADRVEELINEKTKAIIAVDLYGNMPNMDRLEQISLKYGIPLIEDAAEAVGSIYKGRKAGSFGIASTFSFHRTKTITTGEGGMLLIDNDSLFKRCHFLRDHGRVLVGNSWSYRNMEVTFKYMPFNIQAALGLAQLNRIEELIEIKRNHLEKYRFYLKDIDGLQFNLEPIGGRNGAWITGLVFDEKYNLLTDDIIKYLLSKGVPARPFFYPLSSLPAYGDNEVFMRKVNPNAYNISKRGINLPGAMNLDEDQIKYIASQVKNLLD